MQPDDPLVVFWSSLVLSIPIEVVSLLPSQCVSTERDPDTDVETQRVPPSLLTRCSVVRLLKIMEDSSLMAGDNFVYDLLTFDSNLLRYVRLLSEGENANTVRSVRLRMAIDIIDAAASFFDAPSRERSASSVNAIQVPTYKPVSYSLDRPTQEHWRLQLAYIGSLLEN